VVKHVPPNHPFWQFWHWPEEGQVGWYTAWAALTAKGFRESWKRWQNRAREAMQGSVNRKTGELKMDRKKRRWNR